MELLESSRRPNAAREAGGTYGGEQPQDLCSATSGARRAALTLPAGARRATLAVGHTSGSH